MDKETLSNYGWIVIAVLVLVVMIALATPFGKFVSKAVQNTTQGLFDVNQNALDTVNITIADQSFDNAGSGNNGTPIKDPALNPTGITGTEYIYGDYKYTATITGFELGASTLEEAKEIVKQQFINDTGLTWDEILAMLAEQGVTEDMLWENSGLTEETFVPTTYESWKVNVLDKTKTEYGPILESINGAPITDMSETFQYCTSLTTAPAIPNGVTNMTGTFYGCRSLKSITIPDTATTISYSAFQECSALKSIDLGGCTNLTTIDGNAFSHCTSLENINIPSSVTTINAIAFLNCTSLTSITFEGTTAQWNAITFGSSWNRNVPATYVQCSDGQVALS